MIDAGMCVKMRMISLIMVLTADAAITESKVFNVWYVLFQLGEAKELVADAIRAGIFNDLGSGSNVDVCVITKDSVDYIRPYDVANQKGQRYLCQILLCSESVLFVKLFTYGFSEVNT